MTASRPVFLAQQARVVRLVIERFPVRVRASAPAKVAAGGWLFTFWVIGRPQRVHIGMALGPLHDSSWPCQAAISWSGTPRERMRVTLECLALCRGCGPFALQSRSDLTHDCRIDAAGS